MVELRWCQYVVNPRAGPQKKLQYRRARIHQDDWGKLEVEWSDWEDIPTYRQPYKRRYAASSKGDGE